MSNPSSHGRGIKEHSYAAPTEGYARHGQVKLAGGAAPPLCLGVREMNLVLRERAGCRGRHICRKVPRELEASGPI